MLQTQLVATKLDSRGMDLFPSISKHYLIRKGCYLEHSQARLANPHFGSQSQPTGVEYEKSVWLGIDNSDITVEFKLNDADK